MLLRKEQKFIGRDAVQCGRDVDGSVRASHSTVEDYTIILKNIKQSGFQELEALRFHYNWYIKVVRLSAFRTGRLHPPVNVPGTHFC